jgi:hypothetical protein
VLRLALLTVADETSHFTNNPVLSVIAFHEKAGRSQVGGSFLLGKIFSLPSRHCRHPSIRTLLTSDCWLGASWVFSFQPVLPPVYRPCLPSRGWKLGQAFNAVTAEKRFRRQPTPDGRTISLCLECYETVVQTEDFAEIETAEATHECQPK